MRTLTRQASILRTPGCERMLNHGRFSFQQGAAKRFVLGQESFEKLLWKRQVLSSAAFAKRRLCSRTLHNRAANGSGTRTCSIWAISFLESTFICSQPSLKYGSVSPFGAVNAVLPDGSVDRANSHSGKYGRVTYALASLHL